MRELPQIDETHCEGCGDCAVICPTQALAMNEERPWLIRPQDCIGCAACVLVCPTDAISMQLLPPA